MSKDQVEEQHHMKDGLAAIWRHLKAFKKEVNWLIVLGLISAVANGFVPYITGRFYDALIGVSQHQDAFILGTWPLWIFLIGAWIVTQIVANGVDWARDRISRAVDTGVHFNLQADGFVQLLRLPLSYHKNTHINGDLQKISTAGWRISAIISQFVNIAPQLLSILIGIILSAIINLPLSSLLFAGVLIYAGLLVKMVRPMAAVDAEAHRLWNTGWDDAAASVHQVESVKQASAEEHEEEQIGRELLGKAKETWMKLERNWSNINFFQHLIVFITQLSVFFLSVSLVSKGMITVGELIALNGYALMFFGPIAMVGRNWQILQNGITSASLVERIFEEKQEVYHPAGAIALDKVSGRVAFREVRFRYAPDQPDILDGISMDISPGKVIAFVGESGVGKSTTIHLISGYYFPTEGSVEVDGVDTRKLDLTELRSRIAVVPQEVALFNDTIMANIRYGTFEASDEAVKRAAEEAHMKGFIEALPLGYGTIVGERGIKLSVGQKQRIAIARAILRQPSILILDEPTSALDAETERIVTGALEKLMAGRTTFVIAHRLSTVRKADAIMVFQKGRVVEQGRHSELIAKEGGVYRKLYEYQIGLH